FLAYNNPYLVIEGDLYKEGIEKGYFAKAEDGSDYLVDFGEFYCGVVDLTNPQAYQWFKNLIKKYMIEFGIDGWMADFGEYLPTDLKLYNGEQAIIEHNHWPVLWAQCNYEALKETGKLGELVYFMRAGGAGSQKYCTLLWAGDQSVDFTIHDGLASVICGALSAGMIGCGIHHSDIGGYTSLFNNCRTKEVFLRWAEMAAFTPVMRTHEGNRPEENFQFYNDADTMEKFGRLTDIYIMLSPYIKSLVKINSKSGLPVQRPLFIHYEDDSRAYDIQTEYLFGEDMLVAPVYLPEVEEWEVYLPADKWVHLWTGEEYQGGTVTVKAPIGYTPVFYKKTSEFCTIFEDIQKKYGMKLK
ncbi:MAG: alpha-glucosidase, partial [Ruminiclostridium sp.]